MLLETVNHAWLYSRLLTFHLSAYLLQPPQRCRVLATICHAPAADDPQTAAVLDYFRRQPLPDTVAWNFVEMPRRELCRRAIGRNRCCLASRADYVLLGDIDYIFGPGALDAAAEAMAAATACGPKIMYPIYTLASRDHAAGDAEIERVTAPGIVDLTAGYYSPQRLKTAIGGAQWIPGDFARKRGYLPQHRRFQRPADAWKRTFEDRVFRAASGLPVVGLEVPNVYRIRHSKRGRFDIGVQL